MASAVVVGAGQSGLAAARELARAGLATVVVERLPAPGGQEPEGRPERRLAAAARAAGAHLRLGTMAVEWDGRSVSTLGAGGAAGLPADALVLATGSRPATRGELGIAGDRCAGILPGTAAVHLIEAGVLPGRRAVVCGGGGLAARCAELLLAAGADEVTLVSESEPAAPLPPNARVIVGWRVAGAHGVHRLAAVWLERDGLRERLPADALLLAAGRIPMRNVDGAIEAAGAVVACHSTADPKHVEDAERTARAAVERVLARQEVR